jgi:hypothetical protein
VTITTAEVDGATSAPHVPEEERRMRESVATPAASVPALDPEADHSLSVPSL